MEKDRHCKKNLSDFLRKYQYVCSKLIVKIYKFGNRNNIMVPMTKFELKRKVKNLQWLCIVTVEKKRRQPFSLSYSLGKLIYRFGLHFNTFSEVERWNEELGPIIRRRVSNIVLYVTRRQWNSNLGSFDRTRFSPVQIGVGGGRWDC